MEEDAAEAPRGGDHLVVGAVGDRGEDGDAAAGRGAAVGVDVDRDVGAGLVEDLGAAVMQGPTPWLVRRVITTLAPSRTR